MAPAGFNDGVKANHVGLTADVKSGAWRSRPKKVTDIKPRIAQKGEIAEVNLHTQKDAVTKILGVHKN